MGTGGRIVLAAALAAGGLLGASFGVAPARAQDCPGHPDALGTSRVLVVDPAAYPLLGTLQYKQTLPLADHEVVLTFDDGPLPPYSTQVLDTLMAQCVKATFFLVGEMARAYPDMVRREYDAGHTIGTHSLSHPLRFENLTGARLSEQIDGGLAAVGAALGDRDAVAPFFRIPGLGRSEANESALAARGLAVFSVDMDADDWFRHISAAQVVERAMSRLERRGSGILLLHDIHPWTAEALPVLLRQLKARGFHVVHIVPPAGAGVATAHAVKQWTLTLATADPSMIVVETAAPKWPQPGASDVAGGVVLTAPDAAAFNVDHPALFAATLVHEDAAAVSWSAPSKASPAASSAELPIPGLPDLGVSLRGRQLVGADVGARPSIELAAASVHLHLHHARLHAHHPGYRRARFGGDGEHADLSFGASWAAASSTPEN